MHTRIELSRNGCGLAHVLACAMVVTTIQLPDAEDECENDATGRGNGEDQADDDGDSDHGRGRWT